MYDPILFEPTFEFPTFVFTTIVGAQFLDVSSCFSPDLLRVALEEIERFRLLFHEVDGGVARVVAAESNEVERAL